MPFKLFCSTFFIFIILNQSAFSYSNSKSLVGTYSHFDVVNYIDNETFITMKSRVVTYGITKIFEDNNQLIWEDTFCHCDFETNLPFTSEISDSFTRAIQPRSTPVDVSYENDNITIIRPETPTGIGILLENEDDELPTDPNDPRIFDHDQDGKPGVTSTVKTFGGLKAEIYLARLERFTYVTNLMPSGRIEGVVKDRSQQLVVGASVGFLNSQSSPRQVSDFKLSPIILTPLKKDIDCDNIMNQKEKYFPKVPQKNW